MSSLSLRMEFLNRNLLNKLIPKTCAFVVRQREKKRKRHSGEYRIGTHRLGSEGRPLWTAVYEFTGDITTLCMILCSNDILQCQKNGIYWLLEAWMSLTVKVESNTRIVCQTPCQLGIIMSALNVIWFGERLESSVILNSPERQAVHSFFQGVNESQKPPWLMVL